MISKWIEYDLLIWFVWVWEFSSRPFDPHMNKNSLCRRIEYVVEEKMEAELKNIVKEERREKEREKGKRNNKYTHMEYTEI